MHMCQTSAASSGLRCVPRSTPFPPFLPRSFRGSHALPRCISRDPRRADGPRRLLCPTHSQFITQQYPAIKQANPDVKVLIREAGGVVPRVFARFGECEGGRKGGEGGAWDERGKGYGYSSDWPRCKLPWTDDQTHRPGPGSRADGQTDRGLQARKIVPIRTTRVGPAAPDHTGAALCTRLPCRSEWSARPGSSLCTGVARVLESLHGRLRRGDSGWAASCRPLGHGQGRPFASCVRVRALHIAHRVPHPRLHPRTVRHVPIVSAPIPLDRARSLTALHKLPSQSTAKNRK